MEIVLFLVFTTRGPKVREAELAWGKAWATRKKERQIQHRSIVFTTTGKKSGGYVVNLSKAILLIGIRTRHVHS